MPQRRSGRLGLRCSTASHVTQSVPVSGSCRPLTSRPSFGAPTAIEPTFGICSGGGATPAPTAVRRGAHAPRGDRRRARRLGRHERRRIDLQHAHARVRLGVAAAGEHGRERGDAEQRASGSRSSRRRVVTVGGRDAASRVADSLPTRPGDGALADRRQDPLGDARAGEADLLVEHRRRAVRHVAVGQADAQDARVDHVEVVERLPHAAAEAAREHALLDRHEQLVVGRELRHQRGVDRLGEARVGDRRVDAVLGQQVAPPRRPRATPLP